MTAQLILAFLTSSALIATLYCIAAMVAWLAFIVREAGGYVSDYAGRNRALLKGEVLAANDGLHGEMVKIVAAVRRKLTAEAAAVG